MKIFILSRYTLLSKSFLVQKFCSRDPILCVYYFKLTIYFVSHATHFFSGGLHWFEWGYGQCRKTSALKFYGWTYPYYPYCSMWQVCFLTGPFCCLYLMSHLAVSPCNSTQEVRESAGLAFSTLYKVFELNQIWILWMVFQYYGWFSIFLNMFTICRVLDCKPLMRLSPHCYGLWKMMIHLQQPLMVWSRF